MTRAGEAFGSPAARQTHAAPQPFQFIGSYRYGGIWLGDTVYMGNSRANIQMMPNVQLCGFLYRCRPVRIFPTILRPIWPALAGVRPVHAADAQPRHRRPGRRNTTALWICCLPGGRCSGCGMPCCPTFYSTFQGRLRHWNTVLSGPWALIFC